MTDEQAKEIWIEYASFICKYKPKNICTNGQNFNFVIIPEMQEWLDKNVSKVAVENGLIKKANIVSSDFFAQVAIQQLFEEKNSLGRFKIEYFDNEEDAKDWILK